MRTDDPVADFLEYDAKQQEWLERRPVCKECGEHIQDEKPVCIHGDYYCDECIENMRKWIGDD